MEKGTYSGRRVVWERYAAAVFNPFLFAGESRRNRGCGASALALLTGVPPDKIAKLNHYQRHYDDVFMVRFLRRRRFTVLPVTQCSVSASPSRPGMWHVLLLSQLFRKNEGTWGVIFEEVYYHNFDFYRLEALSFLDKPILSAYVIWHPWWRLEQLPGPKPIAVPKARMLKLTLHDLMSKGLVPKITL